MPMGVNTRHMMRAHAVSNDTPTGSHAHKLLPLIGGDKAIENLVDLVP